MGEKIVRRKLRDGTTVTYRYERGKTKPLAGTLDELVKAYLVSPEFKRLSPGTQTTYGYAIDKTRDLWPVQVADIRRGKLLDLRDTYADTPAMANLVMAVMSLLMKYAIVREVRTDNPCDQIGRFETGEYGRWSDDQITHAIKHLPTECSRALTLGLYTAQRLGDVLAMTWHDYDGNAIKVKQQKTGAELWIPVHSALRASLEDWKRERVGTPILGDAKGQAYARPAFTKRFANNLRKHTKLDGLVFHGLRKTAAAKLAEAGCTIHEIGAVTGHKSMEMIAHYTKEAEQRGRAEAAIHKLENGRDKRPS